MFHLFLFFCFPWLSDLWQSQRTGSCLDSENGLGTLPALQDEWDLLFSNCHIEFTAFIGSFEWALDAYLLLLFVILSILIESFLENLGEFVFLGGEAQSI